MGEANTPAASKRVVTGKNIFEIENDESNQMENRGKKVKDQIIQGIRSEDKP